MHYERWQDLPLSNIQFSGQHENRGGNFSNLLNHLRKKHRDEAKEYEENKSGKVRQKQIGENKRRRESQQVRKLTDFITVLKFLSRGGDRKWKISSRCTGCNRMPRPLVTECTKKLDRDAIQKTNCAKISWLSFRIGKRRGTRYLRNCYPRCRVVSKLCVRQTGPIRIIEL